MQKTTLLTNRRWRTALLVLLLGVVGTGRMSAQDFTVDNLNYSINNDGTSVTVTGHVDGTSATGTLDIPESVTYEGTSYAVTEIGSSAFWGCSGFTGSPIIPNSVSMIGQAAFSGCSGFTGDLVIPNSVTTIDIYAFHSCSGFTGDLVIPNFVTTIGSYAFQGCSGFTGNLIIGNSVTTIGVNAFIGCSSFTSVTLPNSLTYIGNGAFSNCLISYTNYIGTLEQWCNIVFENSVSNPTNYSHNLFINGTELVDVNIPETVTYIGDYTFWNCSNFTSLNIPNSVVSIGTGAFCGCTGLNQITVMEDNPNYDSRNNCNAIIETLSNTLLVGGNNTVIPHTVTAIGQSAFWGCHLETINIPACLVSIPNNAFGNCNNLRQITVDQENPIYNSQNNCNAIIETATNTLLVGCNNTVIPESVKVIGQWAFFGRTELLSISIPQSITSIKHYAFENCNNLYSVISYAALPPSLGNNVFYGIPCTNLIVPCGCVSAYEASNWANYFTSIEEDCDSHDVNIEGNMSGGSVSASVTSTTMGEEVQLTITPEEGMMLSSLTVSNSNNPDQQVYVYPIGKSSFLYGFIMPPFDVVVSATFIENTSVQENNNIEAKVYPNPTNGIVKIESENLKHITISNTLGQVIYEDNVNGDTFAYDFSGYQAGIYLIRIETSCGIVVKKVSVAR